MNLKRLSSFIFIAIIVLVSCKKKEVIEEALAVEESLNTVSGYYKLAVKNKNTSPLALKYIDSALIVSKLEHQDSLYLKSLTYKVFLLAKNNEFLKALRYSDSLLDVAKEVKDTFYIAKAYYKKGYYHSKLYQTVSSFKNYSLSKKHFIRLNDSNKIARVLLNMAILQKNIGDYKGAKETLIEGIEFQTLPATKKHLFKIYNLLSIIKKEEKDYEKSFAYKEKSIKEFKSKRAILTINDSLYLSKLLNSKAVIHSKVGNYTEALQLLLEVNDFPLVNEKSNLTEKARILDNIGVVKGKIGSEEAESILLKAYRIRDSIATKSGLNASYIHLCEFYINKNEPHKALIWAKRAYDNAKDLNSLVAQKEALNYITELANLPKLTYIKAYKKVTDSLVLLSNKVRKIYAEERYEAQEYKLEALRSKKKTNEAEFQKKIIVLVSLAFILLLLLYKYYSDKVKREKSKKEQLVAVYKTEIRISKRVHDELANDVYGVMTQLQSNEKISDSSNNEQIMDSLEIIYDKSRNISRETNSIDTHNFIETLKNLLSGYNDSKVNVIIKGLKEGFWNNISGQKKIVVYRVLQELMINMKKHSEASLVVLDFSIANTLIEINYSDNGVGVDLNEKNLKNGLMNAENRIESINGGLIFESAPSKGVKIKMHFKI